jgi:hypothetical protein
MLVWGSSVNEAPSALLRALGLLHESGSVAAVAGRSLGRRQAGRGKAEEDGAQDYSHWLITHLLVLPKQPHWPGPAKSRQG